MKVKDSAAAERILTVTTDAASAGERLDRSLAASLVSGDTALSRSRLKALIEEGRVTSNGATISDPSRRVKPGEVFVLTLPASRAAAATPQSIPLTILYEDDDVIVVDKPAGLVVHPAPGNPDRTLVNALLAHCGAGLSGIGGVARPGIVHRLDKDTSGLLVAAKNDAAHHALAAQFSGRSVERLYQAVVWGVPQPRSGTISGAIGRSRHDRKKMAIVGEGRGKPALTHYRVLKSLAGGEASLIECRLATGRTHQIRVHLASAGHPLIGDPVYGRPTHRRRLMPPVVEAAIRFPRQALDAVSLGFTHPVTAKKLKFCKSLSKDISDLIHKLERI
ncbi:MAG: RluA family pseudouridine synthase [Alphaproteobacteria bacterium]|nr:RluA family pseudouridine synthase [Alphaproteobacteria bacterium]